MDCDVVIIGGGPAGMTAGIYALRAGKKVVMIEKFAIGGQAGITYEIANYPGFKSIGGFELVTKMFEQVEELGATTLYDEIEELSLIDQIKVVKTKSETIQAKAVIIASGAQSRKLGVANELKLTGRGVSYCATCDGAFYKNKKVCVVGGGNTALEDVIHLSGFASKVTLIHRRDEFRGSQLLVEKVKSLDNVEIIYSSTVVAINGEQKVSSVDVFDIKTGLKSNLEVDGIFIAVGQQPSSEIFDGIVNMDNSGYIIVDEKMKTSVDGVYACGDVVRKVLRQVVTACADGAIAGEMSARYISEKF